MFCKLSGKHHHELLYTLLVFYIVWLPLKSQFAWSISLRYGIWLAFFSLWFWFPFLLLLTNCWHLLLSFYCLTFNFYLVFFHFFCNNTSLLSFSLSLSLSFFLCFNLKLTISKVKQWKRFLVAYSQLQITPQPLR